MQFSAGLHCQARNQRRTELVRGYLAPRLRTYLAIWQPETTHDAISVKGLPSVCSRTRRVRYSKMADTRLNISPVPNRFEIAGSSICDPPKKPMETKRKRLRPRSLVPALKMSPMVDYDNEIPPTVNSDEEISPTTGNSDDEIPPTVNSDDEIPPIAPMEKPINEALQNIENLIYIRNSERLRVALAYWESSEQAYRKRVQRKKKVLRNTRNEVITLTGFFLALQALLLTAAAVSSSSQCTNLSFLLAVSGFVTFCALAFVCHKEMTMRRLQRVVVLEKAVQKTFSSRLQQLRQEGELFDFERTNDYIIKSTKFALSLFGFSFTATTWVALAIGIFGALCLVAIDRLLCHSS